MKILMVFFVISYFRDFVIKDLFLFPDKPRFILRSNQLVWVEWNDNRS
jgi:hypothetical protein